MEMTVIMGTEEEKKDPELAESGKRKCITACAKSSPGTTTAYFKSLESLPLPMGCALSMYTRDSVQEWW